VPHLPALTGPCLPWRSLVVQWTNHHQLAALGQFKALGVNRGVTDDTDRWQKIGALIDDAHATQQSRVLEGHMHFVQVAAIIARTHSPTLLKKSSLHGCARNALVVVAPRHSSGGR
jgi:hypothetical protein